MKSVNEELTLPMPPTELGYSMFKVAELLRMSKELDRLLVNEGKDHYVVDKTGRKILL